MLAIRQFLPERDQNICWIDTFPQKLDAQLPVTPIFFGFSSTTCGLHHAGYSRGKRPVIAASVGVKRADAVRMAPASRSGRLGWGIPTVFPRENPQMIPGWWFQRFFYFHPYLGRWCNLTNIFRMGWNHQLDTVDGSEVLRSPVEVGRLSHHFTTGLGYIQVWWVGTNGISEPSTVVNNGILPTVSSGGLSRVLCTQVDGLFFQLAFKGGLFFFWSWCRGVVLAAFVVVNERLQEAFHDPRIGKHGLFEGWNPMNFYPV